MNGIVYSLRFILNISIVFVLTFGALGWAEDPVVTSPQESAQGSLVVKSVEPTQPDLKIEFQTKTIESDETPAVLKTALEDSKFAETVIVSTDETEILKQAANGADSRIVLLPFGKAIRKSADMANGINKLFRGSGHYLVQAFHKDKIGFGIATFTLGNEIVRWIHVTSASNFIISSNIVYSILWASLFVDKDTWSKTTKPIQRTFRKLFGLSEIIPTSPTLQDTSLKFLSGLSLSLILNSGRAMLVGIDQLAHQVFDPLNLAMPFIMGAVMTAVGFSWSELMGSIDETSYPRSKKIVRLVMNSRSCLISYFAASAMLMNPEHYGAMPWIVVSISGATGLVLYTSATKWLPSLERLRRSTAPKPSPVSRLLQCESLFVSN